MSPPYPHKNPYIFIICVCAVYSVHTNCVAAIPHIYATCVCCRAAAAPHFFSSISQDTRTQSTRVSFSMYICKVWAAPQGGKKIQQTHTHTKRFNLWLRSNPVLCAVKHFSFRIALPAASPPNICARVWSATTGSLRKNSEWLWAV